MKTFKFFFSGCTIGAIGKPVHVTETYQAANMGEALFMLHTDYSHVRIIWAMRGKKKLPVPGAIQNIELIDNGYKGKPSLK